MRVHAAANLLLVGYLLMCLLTILHQCTEAVQCKHGLLVILTENKKFNLGFDSRQSTQDTPIKNPGYTSVTSKPHKRYWCTNAE